MKMTEIRIEDLNKQDLIETKEQIEKCLQCDIGSGYEIAGIKNVGSWKSRFYATLKKLNNQMRFTIQSQQDEFGFILKVVRIK